jgi:hypothetical protein
MLPLIHLLFLTIFSKTFSYLSFKLLLGGMPYQLRFWATLSVYISRNKLKVFINAKKGLDSVVFLFYFSLQVLINLLHVKKG